MEEPASVSEFETTDLEQTESVHDTANPSAMACNLVPSCVVTSKQNS